MPPATLNVHSEIGRLRRVLLHEPGPEVDRMVPAMMQDLLFDDILFGDRAREEHAMLRRVLQLLGVETVEAEDLLSQALEEDDARRWVFDVLLAGQSRALRDDLDARGPAELARALVRGVPAREAAPASDVEELFGVTPLPNWCFQRDPQVVLGHGLVCCVMASPARYREAMLSRVVFRFHPDYRETPVWFDPLETADGYSLFLDAHRPSVEGGDLLVLSKEVVAVGRSERTNRSGVRRLARALARIPDGPRFLLAVGIPPRRAYMHLDTLLTPVDRDACLVFPPAVRAGGGESVTVHEIDLRDADLQPVARDDLLAALAARGIELQPIFCGGADPLTQRREQWTDGANALAVAPGTVVLYDRNVATAEEMARHGFRVVGAEDLLLGREDAGPEATGARRRLCVLLPSHELSRARGGPHCLAHPLVRDELAD